MKINLGPETLTLKPPASPSTAMAVIRLIEVSPEWAGGAALALCCPAIPKRGNIRVDYMNLIETGRDVFDFIVGQLTKSGMNGADALQAAATACGEATAAIIGELPLEAEIEEAGNG
jgi:hypothetical protein